MDATDSMQSDQTEVYWVLGLPIDAVNVRTTVARLRAAADRRQRQVFATPNLNFLRACRSDTAFREHVLRCDLSLADGMPVIWLGRLLGVPLTERVAGSTLMEALLEVRDDGGAPLRTFLFGAQGDAAACARDHLNLEPRGLAGVGALNPGAGDLAALSTPEILREINDADADLLVIALGAAKGHAWIEHNRDRLNTRLMSHLGAVVNFLAGTVRRAPPLLQKAGLEWLWRMGQEPRLFRRYAADGVFLLRELVTAVIPLRLSARSSGRRLEVAVGGAGPETRLALDGALTAATLPVLKTAVDRCCPDDQQGGSLALDLNRLAYVDSCGLGFLYALQYRHGAGGPVSLRGGNPALSRLIRLHRAEVLFPDHDGRLAGTVE